MPAPAVIADTPAVFVPQKRLAWPDRAAFRIQADFAPNGDQPQAIAALTDSGATALWMSRHRIHVPIYAMTPNLASQRKMQLYRNVVPLPLQSSADRDTALEQAEELLLAQGVVQRGDFIVLTIGEPMGQPGGTNTLKIVRVGH